MRAAVPIVSCAYALDDLLQAVAIPGEQLLDILGLELFCGVPLAGKLRGEGASGSSVVKAAMANRALLIRELLRFGKLQALEEAKTKEQLEKLAEPDSRVQAVQAALDRVYERIFLSDTVRSRTERMLEALYRNAAKDATGWNRLLRLFDIAALTAASFNSNRRFGRERGSRAWSRTSSRLPAPRSPAPTSSSSARSATWLT